MRSDQGRWPRSATEPPRLRADGSRPPTGFLENAASLLPRLLCAEEDGTLTVLREGTALYDDQDLSYKFEVEVRGSGDPPRAEVAELRIKRRDGGPPITTRGVRDCIGAVIEGAMRWAIESGWEIEDNGDGTVTLREWIPRDTSPEAEESFRRKVTQYSPPERAPRVDEDEVALAAEAYREAKAKGRPATAFVHQRLRKAGYLHSTSTTKRRIAEARKRGLID